MKRPLHQILAPVIAVILTLCMLTGVVVATGTSNDPLITRSYLNSNMFLSILGSVYSRAHLSDQSENSTVLPKLQAVRDAAMTRLTVDGLANAIADMLSDEIEEKYTLPAVNRLRRVALPVGKKLVAETGCVIRILYGRVQTENPDNTASVINISTGKEQIRSWEYMGGAYLITTENGPISLKPLYYEAMLMVSGNYRVVEDDEIYTAQNTDLADALYKMGLFKGTEVGYELDRICKREEALIMLLRLLGKEADISAMSGEVTHPFRDVNAWANNYISYAYTHNITNGIERNQLFGSTLLISPDEYMTFLLRALGYKDSGSRPDFAFYEAVQAAVGFGVISQAEADMLQGTVLERDKMVYISYYGLFAQMKGSSSRLLDKLIETGAIQQSVAQRAIGEVTRVRP